MARSLQTIAHHERECVRVTLQHAAALVDDDGAGEVERRRAVGGQQQQVPDVQQDGDGNAGGEDGEEPGQRPQFRVDAVLVCQRDELRVVVPAGRRYAAATRWGGQRLDGSYWPWTSKTFSWTNTISIAKGY